MHWARAATHVANLRQGSPKHPNESIFAAPLRRSCVRNTDITMTFNTTNPSPITITEPHQAIVAGNAPVASMPAALKMHGIPIPSTPWPKSPPQPVSTLSASPAGHTAAASKPVKKKKNDPRSPELTYAEDLAQNHRFAVKDQVLYQWCGSHFECIDADRSERHALKWLSSQFPERATRQTAKACVAAAMLLVGAIPARDPGTTIVPLKNAYLEVKDDGSIVRHAPDPKFGMTYALNVSLGGTGSSYTPKPLPVTSRLAQYLQTSIPDQAVRDFLQELAGDTLTPIIRFQVATLLKGSGRNGKSVFVKLLSALHDRVAAMRLNAMSGFQLMPLVGASLVVVDEVPKSGFDEQMLKCLISGEIVSIDRKYLSPINYQSTAKWIISTNNDQRSRDNSNGFWRRLTIVPFDHQVPESQVIHGLESQIIHNELGLFLDWCLEGLQRLMVRGKMPPEPAAVQAAKQDAVEASNSIAAWVNDQEVTLGITCDYKKDMAFEGYCQWCSRNRRQAMSSNAFWKGLKGLICGLDEKQVRVDGAPPKRYVNLKFAADVQADAETPPFD